MPAVTTNVPGPPIPLYVLGRRMCSAYAYVPIAGGTRCSIGIFSYQKTMTFAATINAIAYTGATTSDYHDAFEASATLASSLTGIRRT